MISVVLPYWNRLAATKDALAAMAALYADMDLEIIVVDDGSAETFSLTGSYPWPVRVIRLPAKDVAKNPCVPINAGVRHARGDVLVISNPEILHTRPVFPEMLCELERLGERGYVLAAAWCDDEEKWHCHSSISGIKHFGVQHPKGSGLHFCAMLHRAHFERVGGFDEDYRNGAGFDDNDFVMRLGKAGTKFLIRDDLVVKHPKAGARTKWTDGAFERNAALFCRKWGGKPITFAFLKAGAAFGPDYVNKLYDMLVRSLPDGAYKFVCLTDDPSGLDPGIHMLPLPADLERWWGKLYLFKRGLFEDGERIVFVDLDTVIVGSLREIVSYRGRFAMLTDFFFPERPASGVMMWEAGAYTAGIWDAWDAAGRPRDPGGDQWWIGTQPQGRDADRLQTLYPGSFVSYKAHCAPYPPKGARVVCFHGRPRPHEVPDDWVRQAWKIGGLVPADFEFMINTEREVVASNIRRACARPLPWLEIRRPRTGAAAIVGGGPSLQRMLEELRAKAAAGTEVFAVNGAFGYLVERGIVPDWHLIIDARPENAKFIVSAPKRGFLLASQCAPETFDRAAEIASVTVVHMNTDGVQDSIPTDTIKPVNLISSGNTVGLAALALSYCMGFREQFLYGMDSSYEDAHHVYPQALNDTDAVVEATVGARKFKCAPWMIEQVQNFQKLAMELAADGCEIHVRSFGLLGYVAWQMQQQQEEAERAAA